MAPPSNAIGEARPPDGRRASVTASGAERGADLVDDEVEVAVVRVRRAVGEVRPRVDPRVAAQDARVVEHEARALRGPLPVGASDGLDALVDVAGHRIDVVLVPRAVDLHRLAAS